MKTASLVSDKIINGKKMTARTRKNLFEAMKREAFEYAKYRLFAQHARQHGRFDLAELFDKAAREKMLDHFRDQADLLGLVRSDEQDLQEVIESESFEVETMYRDFAHEAREDGEIAVAELFEEIRGDEAVHRLEFSRALTQIQSRDNIVEETKKNVVRTANPLQENNTLKYRKGHS